MPKTIIITGASDGVGAAAARQLTRNGHHVVVVGRSAGKTAAVARQLGADHYLADFARLADVRQLAATLAANYPSIDVLANNAGGYFADRAETVDGFEVTFQVNHLAPALLTKLLMNTLTRSRAAVIQTASAGARMGRLDPDDIEHAKNFNPRVAYATAKLDNILFTQELHRRFHPHGISAAAFHPGTVATNFASDARGYLKLMYGSRLARSLMATADRAARQLVWLAESTPGSDWESGRYYQNQKPRTISRQMHDSDLARKLWEYTEKSLG